MTAAGEDPDGPSLPSRAAFCPPTRFTARSLARFNPLVPSTPLRHKISDLLVTAEMKGPVASNHLHHLSIFPYLSLPPDLIHSSETPLQALDRIFDWFKLNGYYTDGRWVRSGKSPEEEVMTLFNFVVDSAYALAGTSPNYTWRIHTDSEMEDKRKPDVVLTLPAYDNIRDLPSHAILAYCEVKSSSKQNVEEQARRQVAEMAGLVTSAQLGRRFNVGMSLCGDMLSLGLFVRGSTNFTIPFSISDEETAKDFIHILLVISSCSPVWTGFDEKFPISRSCNFKYTFCLEHSSPNPDTHSAVVKQLLVTTRFPVFRAQGLEGKGTVACACTAVFGDSGGGYQHCVLKDCWPNMQWPNDIDIHRLLNDRQPDPIPADEEPIFGNADDYNIFSDCVEVWAKWDDHMYLPGVPIIREWEKVSQVLPDHSQMSHDGSFLSNVQQETTLNILNRISTTLSYEPRVHIRTLSRTCAIPITLFSCRRELFGGFMGALAGHYNGLRKGVLHCDVSESNLWLRVNQLVTEEAVPLWESDVSFVRRAGVLGDWGCAQDLKALPTTDKREGFVTGTIPFIATALLSRDGREGKIPHSDKHDLESFFWVLWSICINVAGPYGKPRAWCNARNILRTAPTPPQNATPSSSRHIPTTNLLPSEPFAGATCFPADRNDAYVPAWATHDQHPCTFSEVHLWRLAVNETLICSPLSPYFLEGKGGKAFQEGMKELFGYFSSSRTSDSEYKDHGPITHKIFVNILKKMRDAIDPAEDHPSTKEVEDARLQYRKWMDRQTGQDTTSGLLSGTQRRGASRNTSVVSSQVTRNSASLSNATSTRSTTSAGVKRTHDMNMDADNTITGKRARPARLSEQHN